MVLEESQISDLTDVKNKVMKNQLDVSQHETKFQKLTEKLDNLYRTTETMTDNDEFINQMEKIQKLVLMSNSSVVTSITGKIEKTQVGRIYEKQ